MIVERKLGEQSHNTRTARGQATLPDLELISVENCLPFLRGSPRCFTSFMKPRPFGQRRSDGVQTRTTYNGVEHRTRAALVHPSSAAPPGTPGVGTPQSNEAQ